MVQTREQVEDARIAPATLGLPPHHAHRFRRCVGSLVWALAGERVINIGDLQNAGQKRNLIASKSVRVPGAIPLLVVVANDRQHRGQRFQMTANLLSTDSVTAHGHPLVLRQLAGFEKDAIRNPNFADVVQIAAAIEREQTHSIQPQSDAESDAGKRETLAVPACIRVALLNGPRQGEDNLFGFIQAGPPAVLRAHLLGALRTGLQQIRPVVPRGRMHAIQVPPSLRVLPDLSALHGYWSYRQAWRNP